MKTIILIVVFLFPFLAFSQESTYVNTYRPKLPDRSSFLYAELDTSKAELNDTSTQAVVIKIIDEKGEPVWFTHVYIINNRDTLKLLPDENGIIQTRLTFYNFRILIDHPAFSTMNAFVPLNMTNRTKQVTVVLGKSFRLVFPIIKSKRPLTEMELIEIIQQISNDNKRPRLVEKGICNLTYEI